MSYGSINGTSAFSQSLAADAQSLGNLKMEAGKSTPESIKETEKQFESLFMKELLKSMRDANAAMKSGMLDNAGSDLGTDLLGRFRKSYRRKCPAKGCKQRCNFTNISHSSS